MFTVVNTNDSEAESLHQAIPDTNTALGTDVIDFTFAGKFVTITPATSLPTISEAGTIEAANQSGFAGTPLVELRGNGAGTANGLTIESGGVTVRGFVVNRFSGSGILLDTSASKGNLIAGNWIGLDANGTTATGNGNDGIRIADGAAANLFGGDDGNDRLDGGAGFADSISGGDGNDTLDDPDGVARMTGNDGNDFMAATIAAGWNLAGSFTYSAGEISRGDGNDTIRITSN